MVNSGHHKYQFFAIYSKTSISESLRHAYGYVKALVVRPLDFGYLSVEAEIQ